MLNLCLALLLAVILLTSPPATPTWRVVTYLPEQPTQSLNVDAPPTVEMRAPIIWSMSFTDDLNGWAACDDGTLLQTTDGGNSWVRRTIYPRVNTLPVLFIDPIGTFFSSNRKGWIIAHQETTAVILGTDDGGRSWQVKFRSPFKLSTFHHIWFVDDNHGWAVGEAEDYDMKVSGGIIYVTTDGGKTWTLQYKGNREESFLNEVKFSDALNGWAIGDKSILHTSDGGATWKRHNQPGEDFFFGVDVISSGEAWVVGSGGSILHTINGGVTWSQSKLPSEYKDHWLNSVKFISAKQGWIVGNEGAIFYTSDGGQTWQIESKDKSSYLRGLALGGKNILAFGNDGVIMRREL